MIRITANRFSNFLLLQGIPILLIALVLMISCVESFHHHDAVDQKSECLALQKKSKHLIVKKSASCQICAYLSVQQVQNSLTFNAPVVLRLSSKTTQMDTPYLISSFNNQVHSWTNKGPPASC